MPSQSRALEASFEPTDKLGIPSGMETIPALEDFDSFFEKLNNIDQVDWRSAHPANPERKAASPASAGSAAAKGSMASKSASSNADPLAGLKAAVAQAKQAQRAGHTPAATAFNPAKKRRGVSGAFRFAATALVLFIVGMGIGWAALSLPTKITGESATIQPAPAATAGSTAGLMIDPKVTLPAKTSETSADRLATIVPLTEVAPGSSKSDAVLIKPSSGDAPAPATASKPDDSMAVDLAAAKIASSDPQLPSDPVATIGNQGIQPSDDLISATEPETAPKSPVSKTRKLKVRTKAAQSNAPAIAAAAAVAQPVQGSTTQSASVGTHYAVQVGACRSAKCIDNYRQLVTTHLPANADHIRVIPVPADGSGMQRVRVAPLDKAEAQQLRAALIQADPRLTNAYVVEVHP